jgi:GNAT superfamily N-acetyltransferase
MSYPVVREVVPSDADALAHVLITGIHTTFEGIVPDRCLRFTETESAANWKRTLTEGLDEGDFMFVLQTEAGIVMGYAWGGPSGDDTLYQGELKQLVILPAYQGQGYGRLLVRRVATRLAQQGIHSLRVEVLRDNPNRPFYERLGAQFISERPHNWDGVIMPMYTYGWKDTQTLLKAR